MKHTNIYHIISKDTVKIKIKQYFNTIKNIAHNMYLAHVKNESTKGMIKKYTHGWNNLKYNLLSV